MSRTTDAAAMAECIAPLDDESRRALRRYWEQVIREEWIPAARQAPRPVPLDEDLRRERRAARRAAAAVVRLAPRRPVPAEHGSEAA